MRRMNCTKRCRIPGDNIVSFPPSLTSPPLISTTCRTFHNNLHYTECSPSVNTLEHIHALIGYKLDRPFSLLLEVLLIYTYTVHDYCLLSVTYYLYTSMSSMLGFAIKVITFSLHAFSEQQGGQIMSSRLTYVMLRLWTLLVCGRMKDNTMYIVNWLCCRRVFRASEVEFILLIRLLQS